MTALRWRHGQRRHRDDGHRDQASASVELVLIVPVLAVLIGVMVASSRVWLARSAVQEATSAAARAASLARTPVEAERAAHRSLDSSLSSGWFTCVDPVVTVDTSEFARPVGVPASVSVSLHCSIPLADLAVPGLEGTLGADATGISALDTYRARR